MAAQRTVWHLLSNRWNSAITEYALSAARALELVGHHNIFTALSGSPAEARARNYGLALASMPDFSWRQISSIRRLAAQHKPGIVMTYGGPEAFLSKFLPTILPVVRFRGQAYEDSGFAAALRHQWAHAHMKFVLTPSLAMQGQLQQLAVGPMCAHVPLGIDTEKYRYLSNLYTTSQRPEVLILGRFDPVKGHARFMRIFKAALAIWPQGRPMPLLHIVGEPANLSLSDLQAAAQLAGLRLDHDLKITVERVSDVEQLLNQATLGVVCSLGSELICRVAEEFLLCGTPILVSGAGSLDEVLSFNEAGASYKSLGDVEVAQLLCDWILNSSNEDASIKRRRAELAAQEFSLRVMGTRLAALLELNLSAGP